MKKAHVTQRGCSLAWALLAGSALMSPIPAHAQATDGVSGNDEEIVVTAQRREEDLQDVPISVSVLGGDELDSSSFGGVTEALNTLPGVSTTEARVSGGSNVVIRGVGAQANINAGTSPVAYYLDSVPFGFVSQAIAPDANAYDLERVEALRGPQGTLFGANAAGGLVRVLTHEADLNDFEFKVRTSAAATERGDPSYRTDVALNLPIIEDRLAVRGVVGFQDQGGWVDKPGASDVNDAEVETYRLRVHAQPTDDLSIAALAWRSRGDYGDLALADEHGEVVNRPIAEPFQTNYDVLGLTVGYDFEHFTLTSSTSHIDFDNTSIVDYSNYGYVNFYQLTTLESEVFSQEIILTSTGEGPWAWTGGVFYRDEEDRSFAALGDVTAPPATPVVDFSYGSKSTAVFGEVSRRFLDNQFGVTLGLRYFEEELFNHKNFTTPPAYHIVNEFDATSPRLVLSWYPNEDLTGYLSYSEGFRSGVPVPYNIAETEPTFPAADPDTLRNYEIGAKGDLFGDALSYEIAAYYIEWDNVQQVILVPFGITYVGGLINGESASGPGVDAAFTWRASEGLSFSGAVSWNDLSFDRDVLSGGSVLFPEGGRLILSPELTASASAEYSWSLGGGYEARLAASANYTSEQIGSSSVGEGDEILISRARFTIDDPNRRLSGTLFADNIGDEAGAIYHVLAGDPYSAARPRPRTIGIQLEYRY